MNAVNTEARFQDLGGYSGAKGSIRSAFDGAACYSTKNIYVQGDHRAFAERLIEALDRFALNVSPVNPVMKPVGKNLGRFGLLRGGKSLTNLYLQPTLIVRGGERWELCRFIFIRRSHIRRW
jgi:hypothetical protein